MSSTFAPCGECGGTVVATRIRLEAWDDPPEAAPRFEEAGVCQNCGETYFDTTSRKAPTEEDI